MSELASASLLYRQPAMYDEVAGDGDGSQAAHLLSIFAHHRPAGVRSLLDVGCGTGRHLADLAAHIPDLVGVDLLPGMVAHANAVRPHLNIRQADMTTMTLGRTFEAVTCLGFSVNYLDGDGAQAALTRMAAHASPGALLVIQAMTGLPAAGASGPHPVAVDGQRLNVTVDYRHEDGWAVMRRQWQWTDAPKPTSYAGTPSVPRIGRAC